MIPTKKQSTTCSLCAQQDLYVPNSDVIVRNKKLCLFCAAETNNKRYDAVELIRAIGYQTPYNSEQE